ncbi:MAG: lipopolysaccharide heptosyltransferase II [Pseudomonadota bacterium]
MAASNLESMLIVKLSAIGDVVHTLPLLEVLRKNYPGATIDWVVEEEASRLLEGHEGIDHLIVSRRKSWQKGLLKINSQRTAFGEIVRFIRELRAHEYDLVIDMQGLFKSGLLTGLARGKRKIGFTGGREGSALFLTEEPYVFDYNRHALDRYLTAADVLGCRKAAWEGRIPVSQADREAVDRVLDEKGIKNKRLVAINPMARWNTKLWDPEKFARLADRVEKELGGRIIFTGSLKDRAVIDRMMKAMAGSPLNLAGKTGLRELAYLYSLCRLLITTDTGPMHIAAAMGCPVAALFGPTAPRRTGPYGKGHRIIREDVDCSPCFRKSCSDRACMKRITVEKVFESVREYF